jgi:hypothetical protein
VCQPNPEFKKDFAEQQTAMTDAESVVVLQLQIAAKCGKSDLRPITAQHLPARHLRPTWRDRAVSEEHPAVEHAVEEALEE